VSDKNSTKTTSTRNPDFMLKVAALVAELGKLRPESRLGSPDEAEMETLTAHCTHELALDALELCLAVSVAVSRDQDNFLKGMFSLIDLASRAMADLRSMSGERTTQADVLRMIASSMDKAEATRDRLAAALTEAIGADAANALLGRGPRGPVAAPKPDKPGSN
jgi:hypothetical protein